MNEEKHIDAILKSPETESPKYGNTNWPFLLLTILIIPIGQSAILEMLE